MSNNEMKFKMVAEKLAEDFSFAELKEFVNDESRKVAVLKHVKMKNRALTKIENHSIDCINHYYTASVKQQLRKLLKL